jgi:serine-type D-Ala-D-Ala carboxypeptidase/endopeptidase (penicillin-binding protein 4)
MSSIASRRAALLGLVSLAVPVRGPAYAAPAAPAAPAARTPLASLPAPVLKALKGSGLPLASFGLEIRAVDAQVPLVSWHADQPLMLASTAKLVTALSALDVLGLGYRWNTQAYVTGQIENGQLRGDLLILGGGDPLFSSADLRAWMVTMRERGLKTIRGDIVLDRSAFRLSDNDHASTPEPAPDRPHHVRPDALTLDEGVLHVNVQATRGGPPSVQPVPSLAGVKVVNQVDAADACQVQLRWSETKGQAQLTAEGSWGRRCGHTQLSVVPPADAQLFSRAVASMWRSVGGQLMGRVREGSLRQYQRDGLRLPLVTPDGEPLFSWSTHRSKALSEVVREINKTSNNLAARHLMLSLAPGFPSRPATMVGAQERVRGWLQRQGFAADDLAIENGSGLSRGEKGRPRAMVQLLCNAINARNSRSFLESLPVAGVDGTLTHRMDKGFATGKAFLKTGSLLDARALAGYVRGQSGRVYAVATLLNHPDAATGRPALDGVIEWLARSG